MNPASKLPTKLPQHVIDDAALREEERFAERAELFTRGKLMKQLEKKYQHNPVFALNQFAETAVRVSEIEAETETHGVYVHASWKHKHTDNPSGGEQLAMMFLGPFGLLVALFSERKYASVIDYTTIHRLPAEVTENFRLKRSGYILGKYLGAIGGAACLIWSIVQIAIAASSSSTVAERWTLVLPLVGTIALFSFAWWCDCRTMPRLLRIYSGGKFKLQSLRIVEAERDTGQR
ncbi:hypothetical protein [Cerasicoccus maritimus]|uniref:hypothetical protein n=1 Tax=Cerasicoccus maritimus TaxID=490089 RepID=UPI002852CE44|nr:hypothetical protein [Cerasicoccus maritimus]